MIIEKIPLGNFSINSNQDFTVGIDLNLNKTLIDEGIVRDLVRQIQNLRKEVQRESSMKVGRASTVDVSKLDDVTEAELCTLIQRFESDVTRKSMSLLEIKRLNSGIQETSTSNRNVLQYWI